MAKKKKKLVQIMEETLAQINPVKLPIIKKVRLAIFLLLAIGLAALVATRPGFIFKADTNSASPVITIVSPANGAVISRPPTIMASATDDGAITKMTLAIDGAPVSTVNSARLNYVWPGSITPGPHTITVTAYDSSGNSTAKSISVYK